MQYGKLEKWNCNVKRAASGMMNSFKLKMQWGGVEEKKQITTVFIRCTCQKLSFVYNPELYYVY